jgi:ribosomal protein S18 acetylase RimI-like enzyme
MRVSELSENDFERVYNMFHKVFDRTKWEQDFHVAWSTRIQEASIGAYSEDGSLLAYAIVTTKEDQTQTPYWFLEFLAVDPDAQGGGLGSTLLRILLEKNKRIALVPLNNDKLIHWYKRHGFTIVSRKEDKWGDPELLMSTIQTCKL